MSTPEMTNPIQFPRPPARPAPKPISVPFTRSTIEIRLGAISDLEPQLVGYGLTKAEIKVFTDDNLAMTRTYIRGYLTDSQIKAARAKLAKEIVRFIIRIRQERR